MNGSARVTHGGVVTVDISTGSNPASTRAVNIERLALTAKRSPRRQLTFTRPADIGTARGAKVSDT